MLMPSTLFCRFKLIFKVWKGTLLVKQNQKLDVIAKFGGKVPTFGKGKQAVVGYRYLVGETQHYNVKYVTRMYLKC